MSVLGFSGFLLVNTTSPARAAPEKPADAGAAVTVKSPALRGGTLHSPMPGGYLGGWDGDTGLDIAGNHLDVYPLAAGTLDYSEWGHTLWPT